MGILLHHNAKLFDLLEKAKLFVAINLLTIVSIQSHTCSRLGIIHCFHTLFILSMHVCNTHTYVCNGIFSMQTKPGIKKYSTGNEGQHRPAVCLDVKKWHRYPRDSFHPTVKDETRHMSLLHPTRAPLIGTIGPRINPTAQCATGQVDAWDFQSDVPRCPLQSGHQTEWPGIAAAKLQVTSRRALDGTLCLTAGPSSKAEANVPIPEMVQGQ